MLSFHLFFFANIERSNLPVIQKFFKHFCLKISVLLVTAD